ncbi:kunitz-type protease inhibitor 1-like [Pimephales promelas]|uniref:kunitz-type protease inhibitor 1-like n=1 Tax=Pimephales promelas TaxID=90988 RepID=UPI0019556066|nr:kunitz-type protease inhibitor 1-like [Pimephales promelas]
MGSWCFRFACLLFTVGFYVRETQSEVSAEDQECIKTFMEGREDFVLDTEESINDGAVFLANPGVEDSLACTVACCGHPRCNLAFVEQGNEKGCFLFNCLYKDKYVCRFFHKEGFKIYVLDSVYENYLNIRKSDKDKAPIANAGRDVVVQPDEEVFLNGIESWDDGKIEKYEWSLIRGDESVQMEKTDFSDQLRVSNLKPGLYEFKLTVTDSAHLSDSDQVSVLVLTPEQSERELSLIMFFPTTPRLLPFTFE